MGRLKAAQCRLPCVCSPSTPQCMAFSDTSKAAIFVFHVERRSYLRAVPVNKKVDARKLVTVATRLTSAMIKRDKMLLSFQKAGTQLG